MGIYPIFRQTHIQLYLVGVLGLGSKSLGSKSKASRTTVFSTILLFEWLAETRLLSDPPKTKLHAGTIVDLTDKIPGELQFVTLWRTNIAIENCHLYWIFPLKMVDLSIAMLVHQRGLLVLECAASLVLYLPEQRLILRGETRFFGCCEMAMETSQAVGNWGLKKGDTTGHHTMAIPWPFYAIYIYILYCIYNYIYMYIYIYIIIYIYLWEQ